MRNALWHEGIRYRKKYTKIPGKPDIAITKYKIAVFCDSEFFHGKGFDGGYESRKYSSLKEQLEHSNNSEFWIAKIQRNMQRDRQVEQELAELGWTVIRFWSKEVLKNPELCVQTIKRLISEKQVK